MQKAGSVCSFAQLNVANNRDRSSMVQIHFRFFHVDESTSTSTSPSVKNQGIERISDKRKIRGSCKIKTQLATASAAATIPEVSLSVSLLCFLHGIVFGTQTLWIDVFD